RALAGFLAPSRQAYAAGLAAIDKAAMDVRGVPFATLAAADQDAVLHSIEATPFFALVRTHTIQGTFCDPFYGGNANFVGWDLIGYPGLRLAASADDQRMGVRATPVRQSAYDDPTFTMKGGSHGHRP